MVAHERMPDVSDRTSGFGARLAHLIRMVVLGDVNQRVEVGVGHGVDPTCAVLRRRSAGDRGGAAASSELHRDRDERFTT